MNRLGIKLACLLVALVIWIQVASTQDVELTVGLPLSLVNLPPDMTTDGSDLPQQVRVRMLGSKLKMTAHRYFGRRLGRVELDMATERPGPPIQRRITTEDVRSDLTALSVLSPTSVQIQVDTLARRVVPVEIVMSGQLPQGRMLVGPPVVWPDSVALSGPARFLRGRRRVRTTPVELDKLKEPVTLTKSLVVPPNPLRQTPDVVEVTLDVAQVETRTFANLPITPLVDAGQADFTVSPEVANVTISGPAGRIKQLVSADIDVTLPLTGLSQGIHRLRAQVILPEGFTLVSVDPEQFVVALGRPQEPDRGTRRP